jgi:hypothetical protein
MYSGGTVAETSVEKLLSERFLFHFQVKSFVVDGITLLFPK